MMFGVPQEPPSRRIRKKGDKALPQRHRILRFLLALLLAIAALSVSPLRAAMRNPEDYPLRVHIYDKHEHRTRPGRAFAYTYAGHGRGNVIDGDEIHAMEYDYNCVDSFLVSEAGEDYPAKWKRPGLSLELLIGVIGSDTRTHACELKVALKDYVFLYANGKLTQISPEEYQARQSAHAEREQALAPRDLDPAHYPLELSLLNLVWGDNTAGMHSGSGQGDLRTPAGLAAVDFAIRCPVVVQTTPEGRYYRGQWTEPGRSMTLLLGNLADPASGATCQVNTVVHPDVYVRQATGIIKAVSQDEYKRMQKTNQ
jgi:hypothetical protein